jgi:uncharacterized protein (TIGR02217 family)
MSTEVFPSLAGLEYPVVRTPIYSTLMQTAVSGAETRAALQLYPRWQWTLSFNFLRDDTTDEIRTLLGFFLARKGSFDSFLFEDPDDNSVAGQQIGIGDGSTITFQILRTFGGFTEPILAPLVFSQVKVGSSVKTPGTDYVVFGWENGAFAPGLISFTSPPGAGQAITASFTYAWPVRFVSDQYDFSKFMNRLWEQKKLDFISVKNQ